MKISKLASLVISLDVGIDLVLDKEQALALYLWTSGVSWEQGKQTLHAVSLNNPIRNDQIGEIGPAFTVSRVNAINHPQHAEAVNFITGPNFSYEVNREELYRNLENFVLNEISPLLVIPADIAPFSNIDSKKELVWETGQTVEGIPVQLYLKQGYLRFVIEKYGEKFDIVDSQLYFGNQSLTRPETVKYISFSSDVYLDGYHGKEARAAIQVCVLDGNTTEAADA